MQNQIHSGTGDNILAEHYHAALIQRPTILADIVNALTHAVQWEPNASEVKPHEFEIQNKINYNNVISYAEIFQDYSLYQGKLDPIYEELEIQGEGKKTTILLCLNSKYKLLKGRLLRENPDVVVLDVVRLNSDEIISQIEQYVLGLVLQSSNLQVEVEYVLSSIRIVLVDAFMRCKILEEPVS